MYAKLVVYLDYYKIYYKQVCIHFLIIFAIHTASKIYTQTRLSN